MVKNGTTRNRQQKYLCRACRRQFIRDYRHQGCRAQVRQLIIPMTLNGSGIRDITRVLRVSINTALKVIRAAAAATPEPHPPARLADVEVNEMWSFVERKRNQSWLRYAFSPKPKQGIGYIRGRRTDAVCAQLLAKLSQRQVTRFYTDWCDSYGKLISLAPPPGRESGHAAHRTQQLDHAHSVEAAAATHDLLLKER